MAEHLIYQGIDIIDSVEVGIASYDTIADCTQADTLRLTFSTKDDGWANWRPVIEDTAEYKRDGASTGLMYVYDFDVQKTYTTLYMSSMPPAVSAPANQSKKWEKIYLSQIGGDIAGKYGLYVIEDATEALGTKYLSGRFAGKYAGTIGDFGAFSFNGNKIITTGGGGALVAKKTEDVEHLRYLSAQAKDDPLYYIHHEIGYNYRMTNLQAALGVAQMEELPEFIRRKQKNYQLYQSLFETFPLGTLMPFREGTESNHWFYSLKIEIEKINGELRGIIERLQEKGIQTRPVWGLIHEQKPYQGEIAYQIEKAVYYSKRVLNIPCSTQITEDEIHYAAEGIMRTIEEMAI